MTVTRPPDGSGGDPVDAHPERDDEHHDGLGHRLGHLVGDGLAVDAATLRTRSLVVFAVIVAFLGGFVLLEVVTGPTAFGVGLAGLLVFAGVVLRPLIGMMLVPAAVVIGNRPLPFVPGGLQGVHLALGVVAAGVLVHLLLFARPRLRMPGRAVRWCYLAIASFLAVSVISGFLGETPGVSMNLNITLVAVAVGVCLVPVVVTDTRDLRLMVTAFVVTSIGATAPVLGQLGGVAVQRGGTVVDNRPSGAFVDPNELGFYSVIVLALALTLVCARAERWATWLGALGALFAAIGLVMSFSRGSWSGFAVALVLLLLSSMRGRLLGAIGIGAAVMTLVGLAAPSVIPWSSVGERFASLFSGASNPYDVRPLIWSSAFDDFVHHPLLGVGPGAFPEVSSRAPQALWNYPVVHAHNGVLTVAAESGILGLATALWVAVAIAVAVFVAWRRYRAVGDLVQARLSYGIFAALAGVAACLMIDYALRNPLVMMSLWFLVGLAMAARNVAPDPALGVAGVAPGARLSATEADPDPDPDPHPEPDPDQEPDPEPQPKLRPEPKPAPVPEPVSAAGDSGGDSGGGLGKLAKGAASTTVGGIISGISGFVMTALVARSLGVSAAGMFGVAMALNLIVSQIGKLGTDTALVHYLPRLSGYSGGMGNLRPLLLRCFTVVGLLGLAAGAVLWLIAPAMADALLHDTAHDTGVAAVRAVAIGLPPAALTAVILAATRGLGTVGPLVLNDQIGKPVLRLIAMGAVIVAGGGIVAVIAVWSLVQWLLLPWAGYALRSLVRRHPAPDGDRTLDPELFAAFRGYSGLRSLSASVEVIGMQIGLVVVAALGGSESAGVYSVATRLVLAGYLTLQAIRLAVAPEMSAALAEPTRARAEHLHQVSSGWVILSAWPIYLALITFAPQVLSFFGPGFESGPLVLILVAAGGMVSVGAGNVQTVLLMSGHPGGYLLVACCSVIANVSAILLLTPSLEVTGAAVAFLVASLVENGLTLLLVRTKVGVRHFGPPVVAAMTATLGTIGVAGMLIRVLSLGLMLTAVAVIVGTVGYLAVCWRLRSVLGLEGIGAVVGRKR